MKTELILEDAETAAVYFRALCDKGVPVQASVSLTASYVSANQITRAQREEPKEPWSE